METESEDFDVGFLVIIGFLIFLPVFVVILLTVFFPPKGNNVTNMINAINATNAINMTSTTNVTNANNTTEEGSYWVPYVPITDEDDWASSDDDWLLLPIIIQTYR